MESAQEERKEDLAGDVMESIGEPHETAEHENVEHGSEGSQNTNDPLYVQKRLKQQKRAHEREIRELHQRIGELQSQVVPQHETANPYDSMAQSHPGVDEQIHKAVSYALQHKELEERKAKEAERQAHVNRQYNELHKHLDGLADKYDDFDDVVRGQDAPFTPHMRDAALFLPKKGAGSAGEVLYKLGKNPEELKRISQLHPLDQASELVALSHALISGGETKNAQQPRTLGQVKSTPVSNSHSITDKTPVSNIRARMKQGTFK